MSVLAFRDVTFDVRTINHTVYITSAQLAQALGYANVNAVTKIYNRNTDEFTPEMSVTQFGSQANLQEARLFSLRGAHLVAMFSRTPVAKEFRRWVLDVLDSIAKSGAYIHAPAMRPAITPEQVRELKTDVACFTSGWIKLEEQWVYNHMRVAFQVAKVEHIPQEFFPLAKQLIASKREAHREFVHFICGLCRWFEREVLGAGTPWTPAIQKKLTKKLKRQVILPPKVDWLALADESKKEVEA